MRNLLEYPVTFAEKIKALHFFEKLYNEKYGVHIPIGDVTLVALREIEEDLFRLKDLIES